MCHYLPMFKTRYCWLMPIQTLSSVNYFHSKSETDFAIDSLGLQCKVTVKWDDLYTPSNLNCHMSDSLLSSRNLGKFYLSLQFSENLAGNWQFRVPEPLSLPCDVTVNWEQENLAHYTQWFLYKHDHFLRSDSKKLEYDYPNQHNIDVNFRIYGAFGALCTI